MHNQQCLKAVSKALLMVCINCKHLRAKQQHVQLLGSGAILLEVIAAGELLEQRFFCQRRYLECYQF